MRSPCEIWKSTPSSPQSNPRMPRSGEPGGNVCSAAAELDRVEPRDVADQPELRVWDLPDAPARCVVPLRERFAIGVLGVGLRPGVAILRGVATPVHLETTAQSRV